MADRLNKMQCIGTTISGSSRIPGRSKYALGRSGYALGRNEYAPGRNRCERDYLCDL